VVDTVDALRLKADVPARLGDAVGTAASTFTAHVIDRVTASEGDGWSPDQAGGDGEAVSELPLAPSPVREELEMSERENQGGDGEIAVCHVCGKKYASQELLSQHLMEEHADDD
jgi:hypothetical protein